MDAALIVFDLSNEESFLHAVSDETFPSGLRSWFKELHYRLDDNSDRVTLLGT